MDREPNGSARGNNISSIKSNGVTTPSPTPPPHVAVATPATTTTTPDPKEYYKTYDVMTGVRIAATLSTFFAVMVLLVLLKSKSKTEKAMEDPKFTAAAVAEVEEEERQLQLALEATAYQQLNPRRSRRSLDTSSAPPASWGRPSTRFSSVGGYSSLMEPPVRTRARRCFLDDDSAVEEEEDEYDDEEAEPGGEEEEDEEAGSLYDDVYYHSHLDVPRRPSNITCSSSGSSYLERRDSAVALGLPAIPAHAHKCRTSGGRRQSSPLPEIYDFYYPIDIRVTQPTPGGSPCGSDRTIYDTVIDHRRPQALVKPKLAPLASISSCNSSLGTDYPEAEPHSFADDSVFREEGVDPGDDTDREVEEFSTDSEEGACCASGRRARAPLPPITRSSRSSSTLVGDEEGACGCALSPDDDLEGGRASWARETLF